MSIALQLTVNGLEGVDELIKRLHTPDFYQLLDDIGATVVSQTSQRFEAETGPDGTRWPEWSDKYKLTRHGGQHLLRANNPGLLSSITHLVNGSTVEVGSALVYAAHHQFGSDKTSGRGSGVPARPYLGIGDNDMDELEVIIEGFVERLLH